MSKRGSNAGQLTGRFADGDAGGQHDVDPQRTFIELRQELRAESWDQGEAADECGGGDREHSGATRQRHLQDRLVDALAEANQDVISFLPAFTEEEQR